MHAVCLKFCIYFNVRVSNLSLFTFEHTKHSQSNRSEKGLGIMSYEKDIVSGQQTWLILRAVNLHENFFIW